MNILEKILEGGNIKWIEISEAGELYGGLKGKTKNDFNKGNAKFVSYKNIFANPEVDITRLENVEVAPHENQNEVKYGDILFTGSSEISSEVGMSSAFTTFSDEKVYLNSFSFGLRLKDEYKLIPEFSKYIFRSRYFRDEVVKTASGVTRHNVSKKNFVKIKIPIPCPENPEKSLEIQKEIVRILDDLTEKNTAIINELSKEIDLRKKQYEHYRDKLLNFNEIGGGVIGEV